jgi:hypothetical protein
LTSGSAVDSRAVPTIGSLVLALSVVCARSFANPGDYKGS